MKKKTMTVEQEKAELISKAVELMKEGHSTSYIKKQLHEISKQKFTVEEIDSIVSEGILQITESYFNKAKDIKLLHIRRYNKDINRLLNVSELDESDIGKTITYRQWLASRNRKIKSLDKALDSMAQLENILELHNVTNVVDVNSELTINLNDSANKKYDISKLTFEERKDMLELMLKAKLGSSVPLGVTELADIPAPVSEDILAEVVPANIELIEQVAIQHPTDNRIHDQSAHDITQKLKARLAIAAAKKFEKAGANLDQKEKNLIDNE